MCFEWNMPCLIIAIMIKITLPCAEINEPFMIIEGQKTFNNFGTWQCYLYHNGNNKAWHIPFKTHHRSVNFANPTVSVLNVNSRDVLFFSLFIPSEKATPNEKGTFIGFYYL
jgi:hypothetical protein